MDRSVREKRQLASAVAFMVCISALLELVRVEFDQRTRMRRRFFRPENAEDTTQTTRRRLGRWSGLLRRHMTGCRMAMTGSSTPPPRMITCPWYIKPRTVQWFYLYIEFSPRDDPVRFRQFFRVSPDMFANICDIVRDDLTTSPPPALQVLPNRNLVVERQVAVAIRRLATGDSLLGIAELFGLSKATVSKCIWKFISAFSRRARRFIAWPQGNDMQIVKDGFMERWNFPNCCGAIDVTHFLIELPVGENSAAYYDWKHNLSITMQAVVDVHCRFLDVLIGCPGSIQDSRVLRTSTFFQNCVYDGTKLNGHVHYCLSGFRLQEYILGDAGYPLYRWLITPYPKGVSATKDAFNHHHSSSRMCVERAFGKLKSTWRILGKIIQKPKTERLAPTVMSCVLLHNMGIIRGENLQQGVWGDLPAHPPGYGPIARPNHQFFEGGPNARDALMQEVRERI